MYDGWENLDGHIEYRAQLLANILPFSATVTCLMYGMLREDKIWELVPKSPPSSECSKGNPRKLRDIAANATAVNRTRTSTLEGWNPNHWTTEAWCCCLVANSAHLEEI